MRRIAFADGMAWFSSCNNPGCQTHHAEHPSVKERIFTVDYPWYFGDQRLEQAFPDAQSRMCACGVAIVHTFALTEQRNSVAPAFANAHTVHDGEDAAEDGNGDAEDEAAVELAHQGMTPAEHFTDIFEDLGRIGVSSPCCCVSAAKA